MPKIKAAVGAAVNPDLTDPPAMAKAAKEFAMTQLTPEALSCYWYGALQRYAEMYFTEQTPAQKEAKEEQRKEQAKKKKGSGGGKEKKA